MHEAMLREVVRICRQRQDEGDHPTIAAFDVETLEDAVVQLAALQSRAPEWRPIEEAPKDGTWILATSGYAPLDQMGFGPAGFVEIVHWTYKMRGGGCAWYKGGDATEVHGLKAWMPLPPPPSPEGPGAKNAGQEG